MQLVFFLYLLATVEATDVFKLVNSYVQMDVQKEVPEDSSVKWTKIESFNKPRIVVQSSGTLSKSYKDRGEFNGKTRSLTLKNLQKSDSGIYVADAENEYVTNVAKYQLYVLDPVEKPVLTHQQSNGTCNATFICKTQYFSVTSNCYSDHCDNKTEKESGNFLLLLYIRNGLIICNHSNPASWETLNMEMKHVKQLCLSKGDKEPTSVPPLNNTVILLILVITVTVGLGFISIIIYFLYKKNNRTTESDIRAYEGVKEGNELQTIEESEKLETAGTVYCNVRKPAETYGESTANPGNKLSVSHWPYIPGEVERGSHNMEKAMQLVFFLYLLATVEATDVFKLVNSSVQLDVQKEVPEDSSVKWTFNKTRIVVQISGSLSKYYKDRGEFNGTTHSLTLKNLQKSDSGIYTAVAENDDVTNVAKYQLYVLDPVEKPVLNVSHQQSNGTCKVTFICKTQYFSVTSNCYSDQCDNKTEKESGNFLLLLYIRNGIIICNHSNPASWETLNMEMKHVKQLCLSKGDKEPPSVPPLNNTVILLILVITVTVGLGFISIIIYFLYKKNNRTTESDIRAYEGVKEGNELQTIEESEKLETAGTVYCNVRKPAETYGESTVRTANPGNKNQGAENIYKSLEFTTPQDIYYTVNKNDKI